MRPKKQTVYGCGSFTAQQFFRLVLSFTKGAFECKSKVDLLVNVITLRQENPRTTFRIFFGDT